MKVPKFSRWVTIPALFILNFLAWLYIYDEYLMGWVVVYPLFMVVAAAFATAAEVAFGRDKQVKYIGINICVVLLLLILAQRYFPMEQMEHNLKENYLGHIKADVTDLTPNDKAVRINGFSIVARNYQENFNGQNINQAEILEVYKDGKLIDKITVSEAVQKIQEIAPQEKKGDYHTVLYSDVRYVGLKRKGGSVSLVFNKGYVDFKYYLTADKEGFIWNASNYTLGGISLPRMEGLYGDETNKKIKNILMKGDREGVITVELKTKVNKEETIENLKALGYEITNEEPLTVKIPFYEIANLSHQKFVEYFEIK